MFLLIRVGFIICFYVLLFTIIIRLNIKFGQQLEDFLTCYHSKHEMSPNVGSMLAHRLRRWPNIEPILGEVSCYIRATFL